MTTISALIICKDESVNIIKTLTSLVHFVDRVFILDTGSTDDTLDLARGFSADRKLECIITKKSWPEFDFSVARNHLISFVNTSTNNPKKRKHYLKNHWAISIDCNDELRMEDNISISKQLEESKTGAMMVSQSWSDKGTVTNYVNTRMFKIGGGWCWQFPIHECLMHEKYGTQAELLKGIVLYQLRDHDNAKTTLRIANDIKILLKYPDCPRSRFYLAQSYLCTNNYKEAYEVYSDRSKKSHCPNDEETYQSLARLGDIAQILKMPMVNIVDHYINAYHYSCKIYAFPRVEPLYCLAQLYKSVNPWISYDYCRRACQIPYPTDVKLFLSERIYNEDRWKFLVAIHALLLKVCDGDKAMLIKNLGHDPDTIIYTK